LIRLPQMKNENVERRGGEGTAHSLALLLQK
jgi:hypothetical protein